MFRGAGVREGDHGSGMLNPAASWSVMNEDFSGHVIEKCFWGPDRSWGSGDVVV